MLKVVVSQRVDWVEARGEMRDLLDQRLIEWLLQVGALAVPLPNVFQARGALGKWLTNIAPQGVVLSGGNDIGSSPERDATETALLDYAAENNLPVLGICRGMQMMACYAGAKLVAAKGHAGTRHSLQVAPSIKCLPAEVNSYHDWALDDCPAGYEIIASASDGTLEAIRHLNRPWEGCMWHPEREALYNPTDIERARSLFQLREAL